MATDRLLQTLLRSLQTHTNQQDTPRLLATAASLLDSLQNPLNIGLLASQLLVAPALWHHNDGLQTVLRLIGVFHSASHRLVAQQIQREQDTTSFWHVPPPSGLQADSWAKAVVKGSEDRAPRWKCSIVLAGLLLGFGSQDEDGISAATRSMLEQEFVKSVNLGLDEARLGEDELADHCITLALNNVFPVLPDSERALIDYDVSLTVH
jgi:hypothetical protein